MATGAIVVLCTMPATDDVAETIAKTLVEERLAACVNLLPGVRSIYRWDGKVTADTEILAVIKTLDSTFDSLKARILELHPYDCPEVIALSIEAGHAPYLAWLESSVERT